MEAFVIQGIVLFVRVLENFVKITQSGILVFKI